MPKREIFQQNMSIHDVNPEQQFLLFETMNRRTFRLYLKYIGQTNLIKRHINFVAGKKDPLSV